MINVLYYYESLQFDTGSPKSMVNMISSLNRKEYKPFFLSNGTGKLIDVLEALCVEIVTQKVESISLMSPFYALKVILSKIRLLKFYKIDVIHMNQFGWNNDVVIAAKLLGVPVVLHCHNGGRILKNNLNLRCADRVLTCSKKVQQDIINFDLVSSKSEVLYNLVDCDKYKKGRNIRAELDLPQDTVVVGTVAQISHRKGIDIFIDAAEISLAKYPSTTFVVIGPDAKNEKDYVSGIKNKIIEKGLVDKVRFLGSRQDIPDIMASIDIFMFTTRKEPFGMVITEAMAAKKPVIASDVGGIPEILETEKLGLLVQELTGLDFSVSLNSLIDNPAKREEIGLSGAKHVAKVFDKPIIANQLEELYRSLIGERNLGR